MTELALVWRLCRRELRAGVGGFRILFACIAIGVAAIAAVGSLSEALIAGLRADARPILGGDVSLRRSYLPPSDKESEWLDAHSHAMSGVVEMRAMARPADTSRRVLVELKAVDGAYPLVGELVVDPPMPLADAFAERGGVRGALAEPALIARLGAALGDRLRVGDAVFEIRGTIVREPDRVASAFSLGPRLMIAADALGATDLVQPGSLVRYETRVVLEDGTRLADWTETLEAALPDAGWRVRDVSGAAPGVRRFVERMTLFLSFVGLSALLVGGVGVGNAVRAYLDGRLATIATFKCLGAAGHLVFRIYLLQVMLLAAIGVAIGLVAGAALPPVALTLLEDQLPVRAETGLFWRPLALAGGFGLLTALTFAIWPVAQARAVPAARLYRDTVAPVRDRPRWPYLIGLAVAAGLLAALTIASSEHHGFAMWFVTGALASLLLLRSGAMAVAWCAARLKPPRRASLRLAVANLHRPGAATPTVMVSLGIGIAVLVAVALIEGAFSTRVRDSIPETAPAFFFIDIQDHQAAAFDRTLAGVKGLEEVRRVPSLRGRIVEIKGVPAKDAIIAPGARWAVRGDRGVTAAATPPEDTTIVDGAWWPAKYAGPPQVSLDAGIAEGLGLGIGDTLTVSILGRRLELEVASLRAIDWRSVPFAFTLIVDPATIAGAPLTHVAAVFAPAEVEDAVEAAISAGFPNVTTIRVRDALETVNEIITAIGDGVRGAALVAVVAGIVVLAGAMAADQERRTYDAVVFKVLGATRRDLVRLYLVEYGVLGLVTGLVAAAIGAVAAWAVTTALLQTEWVFLPGAAALTVLATIGVTQAAGFAGTWRALGRKPAPLLRNE